MTSIPAIKALDRVTTVVMIVTGSIGAVVLSDWDDDLLTEHEVYEVMRKSALLQYADLAYSAPKAWGIDSMAQHPFKVLWPFRILIK